MAGGRTVTSKRWKSRGFTTVGVVAACVGFILFWHAFVAATGISSLTLPGPLQVWEAARTNWVALRTATIATLTGSLIAFGISAVLGVLIACGIAQWDRMRKLMLPVVVSIQAAPKIALAPLFVLWVGYGPRMAVIVGVLVAIFPMIINTVIGLETTNSEMLMLARTMRARQWQIFARIRLPFALPHIMSGLKNCLLLAVVGVVVGEMTGANSGLGYTLLFASAQFRMDYALAATVILMVLGISLFYIIEGLERKYSWYIQEAGRSASALQGAGGNAK